MEAQVDNRKLTWEVEDQFYKIGEVFYGSHSPLKRLTEIQQGSLVCRLSREIHTFCYQYIQLMGQIRYNDIYLTLLR